MGEGDQGQEVNFAFVSPWSLVKGSAYAVTSLSKRLVVCGVRIPRVGPAAPGLIERIGQRLFGGLAMLSSQCSGNLGNALLKLTVGIVERLRRWQRGQFFCLRLFQPAS